MARSQIASSFRLAAPRGRSSRATRQGRREGPGAQGQRPVRAALLNLTLPVGRGLTLRFVERPALALAPADLVEFVSDLQSIARAVMPDGTLRYGVLGGERVRLENAVVTILYDRRAGRPVAFDAMSLMGAENEGRPIEVLHLGLVMIDPAFRGRGLSELLYGFSCSLLLLRRWGRPIKVCSVSQVPAVVGMVAELFDGVFPTPARRTGPNSVHRSLARQIMVRHRGVFGVGDDAWFDEDRSIICNAYTGGSDDLKKSFDAAPKHRDQGYNEYCADCLDYARGDDVLQIGQLDAWALSRHLAKTAKPASALWLALGLFAQSLHSVSRWFEGSPWSVPFDRRAARP